MFRKADSPLNTKINLLLKVGTDRVDLSYANCGNEGLMILCEDVKKVTKISELYLCGNNIDSVNSITPLNTLLSLPQVHQSLKVLELGKSAIGEYIKIYQNTIDTHGLQSIAPYLESVQALGLAGDSASDVFNKLIQKQHLKKLDLSNNIISSTFAENIANELKNDKCLSYVDMSHCGFDVRGVTIFISALSLRTNKPKTICDFSGNLFNNYKQIEITDLSKVVRQCNFETLFLNNCFNDESMKIFLSSGQTQQNTPPRNLYLESNQLTDSINQCLVKYIETAKHEILSFSFNFLKFKEDYQRACAANPDLGKLYIDDAIDWDKISENIERKYQKQLNTTKSTAIPELESTPALEPTPTPPQPPITEATSVYQHRQQNALTQSTSSQNSSLQSTPFIGQQQTKNQQLTTKGFQTTEQQSSQKLETSVQQQEQIPEPHRIIKKAPTPEIYPPETPHERLQPHDMPPQLPPTPRTAPQSQSAVPRIRTTPALSGTRSPFAPGIVPPNSGFGQRQMPRQQIRPPPPKQRPNGQPSQQN